MAVVNVTSVNILNNPCAFTEPLQFEIQYECLAALEHDLEWRLTYVGSAETEDYDQVLDSVLVGPVSAGQYRFVLQTNAPDASKLKQDDIIGVTIVLLGCLYKDKEFLRVGYYVNNDYSEPEMRENPPDVVQVDRLVRTLLDDKPRVTRLPIEWDELPQSVPTIGGSIIDDGAMGDENQPPLENQAFETMEDEEYSAQKQGSIGENFQHHHNGFAPIGEYQQELGFNGFNSGFGTPQPGFVETGGAMEE